MHLVEVEVALQALEVAEAVPVSLFTAVDGIMGLILTAPLSFTAAARGARGGGRGALRGTSSARGGTALAVDGKSASDRSAAAGTSNAKGATWADAVAATSSKPNGGTSGDWGDDTEGLDLKGASGAAAPTATAADGAASSVRPPVQDQSSTAAAAAPTDTASTEEPGMVASVMAKILPSALIPKGSKMSWAQVARPAEPAKPEISAPVLTGVYTSPAAAAAANAPTEALSQKEQQPSGTGAVKSDEVAPSAAIANAPLSEQPSEVSAAVPSALESTAIPASNAVESTTAAPASAAIPSKPGMGRAAQSQRSIQRAQQQEAVVMAGKNAQYDNLGVRFGSLSFLGGDDNDLEEVPAANGSTAAPALGHASTGKQEYSAPTNTYSDHFSTAATSAPSAAPLHVQQQTQTTPTHQDAFAQASSSPYNGNKQEAPNAQQYGYQQGISQHQQAHQAAVAQAQQAHQQLPQQSTTTTQQVEHQYQQSGADATSAGYGANPAVQTSQGQHQLPNSQYADYYANLDSQRLASFYGSYDQQSALSSRGNEERSASQQQGPGSVEQPAHQSHPSAAHASTPQQQQQFPGVMPYYYPQYYLPNQFQQQHYGQPGAGYGQYALYGQQPQHPSSKPAAVPNTHQSPYSQNGPAELSGSGGAPYGNTASGQYGQSPAAAASLTAAGTGYGDGGLGRQGTNASTNDYSKLYGNMATPTSTHSSSIPGLGGFLGQTASGPTNGSGNAPQNKSSAPSNALENAYRGYDNGKMSPAIQGQQQTQQQHAPQQGSGQQPQQQQQRQQTGATPQQQQQQYYQQYNAYAAHQPGAATGNYGNYPYTRQYWQ